MLSRKRIRWVFGVRGVLFYDALHLKSPLRGLRNARRRVGRRFGGAVTWGQGSCANRATRTDQKPPSQHQHPGSNHKSVPILQVQAQLSHYTGHISSGDWISRWQLRLRVADPDGVLVLSEADSYIIGEPHEAPDKQNVTEGSHCLLFSPKPCVCQLAPRDPVHALWHQPVNVSYPTPGDIRDSIARAICLG